jgi:hypothetical protein
MAAVVSSGYRMMERDLPAPVLGITVGWGSVYSGEGRPSLGMFPYSGSDYFISNAFAHF